MAGQTDPRLLQARQLIQNHQQEQARALLVGMLKADPNDIRALYLYAHVARNREEAEKVLKRILKIAPNNAQAHAALNKLQGKTETHQPVIQETTGIVETVQTTYEQESKPEKSRTHRLLYLYGGAIVITLLIVAGVFLALGSLAKDPEPTPDTVAIANTENAQRTAIAVLSSTPTPTRQVKIPDTWTPQPSPTVAPTNTRLPTSTRRPSATPFPTLTTTPIIVQEVETINLPLLSRWFNEYGTLSVQGAINQDAGKLTEISQALLALQESIRLSKVNTDQRAWLEYLNALIVLLDRENDVVLDRRDSLLSSASLNTEESESLRRDRLIQLQDVENRLDTILSNATATRVWLNTVDALKTPSPTAIVIPTSTLASDGG